MQPILGPIRQRGPFWTPITPQTGSFFHAESHIDRAYEKGLHGYYGWPGDGW